MPGRLVFGAVAAVGAAGLVVLLGAAAGSAQASPSEPSATPSTSVSGAPTDPDLRMVRLPGSGENQVLPLGTGQDGDFAAVLTNVGATAPSATLTITLPPGLGVDDSFGVIRDNHYQSGDDNGGSPLTCTTVSAAEVTCVLGKVKSGANTLIEVPVQALPNAPFGTTASFSVSALADSGLDANPRNNSTGASVEFAGEAHLTLTLTPSATSAPIGQTINVAADLHNDGPQPTADAIAFLALTGRQFKITGFTGKVLPIDFGGGGGGSGSSSSAAASSPAVDPTVQAPTRIQLMTELAKSAVSTDALANVTAAAGSGHAPIIAWNVGTIASGASLTATLTLKAVAIGKLELTGEAFSAASDPACETPQPTAACTAFTQITLSVTKRVAPTPTPTASSTSAGAASPSSSSSSAVSVLANSGTPTAQLSLYGLTALLAGGLLVIGSVARRRRPRHLRRH
ncbi:hypothetical protein [Jatrophihabitans sp.]|uniref:hypothetical protein n=1 Tax=Jatrophihabitans sp. TaxID=1932789 RepID=UPI0030C67102|nr:hypothetical protein [Jatrophihabitans sp.]